MTRPETRAVPATFGQLFVLRQHADPGNGGRFPVNQAHVCRLPPGVPLGRVVAAWRTVVRDNEALRTTFRLGEPRPVQLIHPPGDDVELPCHEFGPDAEDPAFAHTDELAATPIAADAGPPVRAFVGLESGRPRYLGFAIHHAAADHTGCLSIDHQLHAALRGEPAAPPAAPSDLAAEQARERRRHDQTAAFWADRWPGFVTGDHTSSPEVPRYRAHLYTRAGMRAAEAVAARARVSAQAVVLAVAAVVAGRREERPDPTVGLVAGNRLDPRWARTVTSMYQTAPIRLRADPAAAPVAFLREAFLSSGEAYMKSLYDVDLLRSRLVAAGTAAPSLLFDTYFNFLGPSGDEVPDEHVWSHSVEVRPLPDRVGPRALFIIATGPGMHIQIRASADFAPPERLGRMAAAVEAGLISLADRQPDRLDGIRLAPLREVRRAPT